MGKKSKKSNGKKSGGGGGGGRARDRGGGGNAAPRPTVVGARPEVVWGEATSAQISPLVQDCVVKVAAVGNWMKFRCSDFSADDEIQYFTFEGVDSVAALIPAYRDRAFTRPTIGRHGGGDKLENFGG